MQELWDDTTGALRQLANAKVPSLIALSNTVHRISSLAGISNCVDVFEAEPRSTAKGAAKNTTTRVVDILLELIRACGSDDDPDAEPLVLNAMKAMLFYYMWMASSLRTKIEANETFEDVPDYEGFTAILLELIDSRPKVDEIRLTAIGNLLDLYTLFATFKHSKAASSGKQDDGSHSNAIAALAREMPLKVQESITSSFVTMERIFAKKSKRTLESASDDDPPEDPESEPEDSSDEEDDDDEDEQARRSRHRKQELLLYEKRLCELTGKIVLAIVGRVLDSSGPKKGSLRKRLLRNKSRLGANFKEVVGYLDEPKPKKSHKAKAKTPVKGPTKAKGGEKSKELVDVEDDEDEEVEEVEEGGEEDLRRRELVSGGVEESGGEEHAREQGGEEVEDDDVMGD